MKKLFMVALLFFAAHAAFSQRFINGIGVCVFSTSGNGYSSVITGGLTYSPRVNIAEMENASVSIGLPLSIGIGYSTNSGDGNASANAVVNVPLVVNYNIGCGSTRDNESRFGFFAGGGFGYHAAAYAGTDEYGEDYTNSVRAYGPVGNAGIRIGVGRGAHNFEIKASYMKGLDISKANIGGLACIFNF